MAEPIDNVEVEIRRAFDDAEYERAATLIVAQYGPEILGFLTAWVNDQELAAEVFSIFTEDLWVGLRDFKWQCTVRGWAYTLARNAARRHHKHESRRHRHFVPLRDSVASVLEGQRRSSTASYLKTAVRERMRVLRQRLPTDDQSLLILRVHRKLPWRELAIILSHDGLYTSQAELEREAARLRKRFQLATSRLREWARADGLLE
jgi:RNA polymerase sigma-70 factor, ECF subfamily